MEAALPHIAALERMVEAAANEPAHVILSHRDADPKNILIERDGRVLLIDWDAVGPVTAQHDVAQEAISWATQRTRMPEPDVLRAFIGGYRQAGGVLLPPQPADVAEFWNTMMRWCAFNLRRVLGERLQDERGRELAAYHARRVVHGFEQWRSLPEVWAAALA